MFGNLFNKAAMPQQQMQQMTPQQMQQPQQGGQGNIMAQLQQIAQQAQANGMSPQQYAIQMLKQNGGAMDEGKLNQFVGFAKQFGISDADLQNMINTFKNSR